MIDARTTAALLSISFDVTDRIFRVLFAADANR